MSPDDFARSDPFPELKNFAFYRYRKCIDNGGVSKISKLSKFSKFLKDAVGGASERSVEECGSGVVLSEYGLDCIVNE